MARRRKIDLVAMEHRIQLNKMTSNRWTGDPPFVTGGPPKGVYCTPVIICGTRTFDDYEYFRKRVDRFTFWFDAVRVIIGSHGQRVERNFKDEWIGADALGKRWAEWNWWPYLTFWADWKQIGKRAGPLRNTQMATEFAPDAWCVAFWDGKSPGTASMINEFLRYNDRKRLRVYRYSAR